MNAIINLNHFCENHGPQTIFSTQTLRDRALLNSCHGNPLSCLGCGSIGTTIFTTTDKESPSILFVSSEKNIIGKDSPSALITLRSLSCEITSNDQGLVYFGDSKLNSLCFTFKVKDSQARGFEKLYSIVIIMKDKMFLLNTQPFLASNIKDVAKQIQDSAEKVYETEQKQVPQRAERLNTGKCSNVPPRSLKELTGESNVFAHLHSLFSWILWGGSRYYTEIITLGTPSTPATTKDSDDGFAFIQVDKEEFLLQNFPSSSGSMLQDFSYNLRQLKALTTTSFNQILYYSLVGVQIVVRGDVHRTRDFCKYFKEFLPTALHRFIIESNKYLPKCKILCLSTDVAIPQNNVCRIEFTSEDMAPTIIKCPIELPARLPALMVKIQHAIDEKLFTNNTLDKFIRSQVEEWKNKVFCLSHPHDDLTKLKKTFGIQAQDELLVTYWLSAL